MSRRAIPCLLLLTACPPEEAPPDGPEVDPFWTDLGDPPPAIPGALGLPSDAPPVAPLWSELPAGRTEALSTSELGYFAVGNGSMFSVLGVGAPANTLHNLTGPDYDKADTAFWPDVGLVLMRDGEVVPPEAEAAMRLQGTAVVLTRLEAAGVALWTVDAAVWSGAWPAAADQDVPADHAFLLRRVLVEDVDGKGIPDDLTVQTSTGATFEVDGDWLRRDQPGRHLWVGERADGGVRVGTLADGHWSAPAQALAEPIHLHVATTWQDERPDPGLAPSPGAIGDTIDAWTAWSARGLQLDGPARVRALLDTNRIAVHAQMSARGEPCPMIFYSRLWNRDLIGPVRFYLTLGLIDEARAMLDAHFNAVSRAGDLANSYSSHNPPVAPEDVPDFESNLAPNTGRSAAEGPSYTPLAYHALWTHSGSTEPAGDRIGLLVRALRGQARTDGLLPFSGDETFRPVMATSYGLPLTFLFEEETWSANSGLLWVAAAEKTAELAREIGRDDLADELEADAVIVREATEQTFRQGDGILLPFVYMDDSPPPEWPYQDVSMKEAWSGYVDPLDPGHLQAVDATIDALWHDDGIVLAPLDPSYEGFSGLDLEIGIATGMSPGYGTWTLARTFRPELGDAARFLASAADPGGTWPEVLVVDSRTGLTPLYLSGGLTEPWARYRPWEGGIDVEALLVAMSGIEIDGRSGTLRLSPGVPEMGAWTMRDVAVGPGVTAEVVFTPGVERHELSVTAAGQGDLTVVVEAHVADGDIDLDGAPTDADVVADDDLRRVLRTTSGVDGTSTWSWPAQP